MKRAWFLFAILHAAALFFAWDFTVDDAYIVSRFLRNWVRVGSWGMNPYSRSDGVTSPLFLMLCAIPVSLGVPTIAAQKAVGATAFVLAQAIGVRGWLLAERIPSWMVPLLAFAGFGFVWAVGGLETSIAGLALTLSLPPATSRSSVLTQMSTMAIPWIRPELVPVVLLFRAYDCRAESPSRFALAASPLLLSVGTLVAWRLWMFGDPLPLAFYAKQGDLEHGIGYVWRSLPFALPLLLLAHVLSRKVSLHAGLILLVTSLSIALAGGDWMPGQRLFQPVFQVLFVWLGRNASERGQAKQPALDYVKPLAAVLWTMTNVLALLLVAVPSNFIAQRSRLEPLRRSISRCSSVALVDAGFLVHDLDVQVVDLAGLTHQDIAHLPGGHLDKHVSLAFLRVRSVQCVVLHRGTARFPVEERLRDELREQHVGWREEAVLSGPPNHYSYRLYRIGE